MGNQEEFVKHSIFISHRNLDGTFAGQIESIAKLAGLGTYIDNNDPSLQGPNSRKEVAQSINRGLEASTHMIAIISQFSRNSDWVPFEIGIAQQRGLPISAVVQNGVRQPEYIDSLVVLKTTDELIDWIQSAGQTFCVPYKTRIDLDTWFDSGVNDRAHIYRSAIDHLESLWRPSTWNALQLADEQYAFSRRWMGVATNELIHILYSLIAPMVALYPKTAGLTESERVIIESIYRSFSDDESFARIEPEQEYEARRCTNWRTLRQENPRKYWLQGLLPRDLDTAREAFRDDGGNLLSRGALAQKYIRLYEGADGKAQKPLGLAANALQGFRLDTRPVFARLVAAQIRMYGALLKLEIHGEASIERATLFDLGPQSPLRNSEEEEVSKLYLEERVIPEVARAVNASPKEYKM